MIFSEKTVEETFSIPEYAFLEKVACSESMELGIQQGFCPVK